MTVQPPTPFPIGDRLQEQVSFDRHELGAILALYGRMVAMGEWRDYGISHLRDVAVFVVPHERVVATAGIGECCVAFGGGG